MSVSETGERSGSAAAIVLIHGDFADGFEAWGRACELIGRRYRTIVVDRPGAGEELGPEARFSIAGDAADVVQIAAVISAESYHLVGHSYGALVALEAAVMRPDAVRSLHLIEPPLLALAPDDPDVSAMDQQVREIQSAYDDAGDEATGAAFFAMIGAEHVVERLRGSPEWRRLCVHASRLARSEPAGDYSPSRLGDLPRQIPVTLYSGGRSHLVRRELTVLLAKAMTGARIVRIPEAGHAVQMAGAAFVDPLMALVREADAVWDSGR